VVCCIAGTFSPELGAVNQTTCQYCAYGKTSLPGSIAFENCHCAPGFFDVGGMCSRCPTGHFCPGSLEPHSACPVHATTPFWSENAVGYEMDNILDRPGSIRACECVDGYFRADNTPILQLAVQQRLIEIRQLHDTFCVICPVGVFCTSKSPFRNTNYSASDTPQENGELCPYLSTTTSTASTSIADCECEAGTFRRQNDNSSSQNTHIECVLCESNHYCPKIRPYQIVCPMNTVSAAGMMLLSDCFCLPPFVQIPGFSIDAAMQCVQMYKTEESKNSDIQTHTFSLQTDMLFSDNNPTTCLSVITGRTTKV